MCREKCMLLLGLLLDRTVIVALAVLGAGVATYGNHLLRGASSREDARTARHVLHAGYAITAASVMLFIVAGFTSGR